LVAIHLAIAIHVALWLEHGRTVSPLEPSEAMEFSKRSIINAGFVFFVLAILSTLVLGRFFCGWACHLVAIQDLCAALMKRIGITPRPLRSRWLATVPFFAGFYMFLWPFVERIRHKVVDLPVTVQLETTQFWATFPGLAISILTLAVAGFATIYFLGAKGFCTYACPYGAFFNVADRLAPLRIRVNDDCEGCGHCTIACTSNVAVAVEVRKYGMVVDPGCMKCLDCVSVCPKEALSLSWGKPAIAVRSKTKRTPRFGLGYELVLAVAFLAAFFAFRGLYGRIPFLMSLGLAGCLAFLTLRTVELFRKARVQIAPMVLKDAGNLTRAGVGFLVVMTGVFAFWGYSGWIRYADWQCQRAYAPLIPVRDGWFTNQRAEVTPEIRATAQEVIQRADRVIRWGLAEVPRVRVERGWAHMILGEEEPFFEDLAIASRLATKDVNSLVERGHALRAAGKPAAAVPLYREAVRRNPDQPATLRYLVDASLEGGVLDQAIEELKSQAEARKWDAMVREFLAMALAQAGQDSEAEATLLRSVELSKPGEGPWGLLAERYWATGRKSEVIALLEPILSANPTQMTVRSTLISALDGMGERDRATQILDEGLRLEPQNEMLRKLQQTRQP